ncbi:alpha/beta fold hydrolase [Nocardia stercoris]|uniref:Alpha/beta hydrolase n=1 Tax=Nocardia stercoris TaxID=2483361 RepID=A0A3M2LA13_9NOCA|nr:alpha/beta hydrolase [Nocardia stercoris]RMI33393.1 alpha/beta hydrolase [Nocardia stercoris]
MPLDIERSPEHLVTVGDIELCVTTFGDRRHPAVVLPSTSRLFWADSFCDRLAAAGRFVLRYDMRDSGRSTTYPAGAPGYSLRDLAADIVGLLEAFDVPRAHLVGFSVAGWICQLAALDHPDRVSALTLIATRPTAPGPADPDLPEHSDRVLEFMTGTPAPDWSDRAAVIDYQVAQARILAGASGFDEAEAREQAARITDRTTDVAAGLLNVAFAPAGDRWRERLGELTMPTLVVHGTDDPFFPYGNGQALVLEIPGATLLPLPGIGHELPATTWDRLAAAMLALQPAFTGNEGGHAS